MTWRAKIAVALAVAGLALVAALVIHKPLAGILFGVVVAVVTALGRRRSESGGNGVEQDTREEETPVTVEVPAKVEYEDPLESTREDVDERREAARRGHDFIDRFDRERAKLDDEG